jgi:hypothetical protein
VASAPSAVEQPAKSPGKPLGERFNLYLPQGLYEGLREAAFRERCKIHDIVLQGIELALRKRGWRKS